MKYLIKYNRKSCIGAGICVAAAPDHWIMDKDGKANLIGSRQVVEGQFEKEIDDKDLEQNKQAAEGCPAVVIHIFKKDTSEKLA